ncbi:calcium/sodium antiporter [Thermosulfidibacter takaii]|nr:calcium/sodium antiporter [Thermosulfidibacter takaii]
MQIALLAGGAAFLTVGANYFVDGASKLARKLNVSQLFIGITLVALGTSLPEFFVSFLAAIKGKTDISIGNIVGSNICNIGLILGTASLARPVLCVKSLLKFEYPLLLISSFLLYIFSINLLVGRTEGFIFLVLLAIFLWHLFKTSRKLAYKIEDAKPQYSTVLAFLLTTGGLGALILGSEIFIKAAVNMARYLGISELIIGLSLVALGTSLPELASTVAAVLQGKEDIATGNVVGSNILNILFIIGITSIVKPIPVDKNMLKIDFPFMIGLTIFLFLLLRFRSRISRLYGLLLLTVYIIYIALIYTQGRF